MRTTARIALLAGLTAGCAGRDPMAERLGDAARSFTVEAVVPPR